MVFWEIKRTWQGGKMRKIMGSVLVLGLVGCTTVQENPRQWNVKVTKSGESKIWVYKNDGSKQCGMAPPQFSPDMVASDLRKAGVVVFQTRTGSDGMMRNAVCGADTGDTVDAEIAKTDLKKAQAMGFRVIQQN
jgi:hypothetical protein